MAKSRTAAVIDSIEKEHGELRREGGGRSLFRAIALETLIYFRYSKIHPKKPSHAFFGLRGADIDLMRGKSAFICFVTDDPEKVFLLPFAQFEHLFPKGKASGDGQYKVNLHFKHDAQIHLTGYGKYSIDRYQGLSGLRRLSPTKTTPTNLSHAGVQSLLGKIGLHYRYNLWFPRNDLGQIDRSVISTGNLLDRLPEIGREINPIMEQIDVIWLEGGNPVSLFEVEHTTTIYSGLLRLCDTMLALGKPHDFRVVARKMREEKFYREIHRPTFRKHRLEEKVSFMSYDDAWHWLERLDTR